MKSKDAIQLEYRAALLNAERLKVCAYRLRKIRSEMDALANELQTGWQGDSARACVAKCSEFSDKVRRSDEHLEEISRSIRRTARAYRDAETVAVGLILE